MTVERVVALWDEFLSVPFPVGWATVEVAGCDVVSLDSLIAGCVSTWLRNGGSLDDWRRGILASRLADLDRVLPELTGEVSPTTTDSTTWPSWSPPPKACPRSES